MAPRWEGDPPPGFAGVVTDSREARPGVLFCALRGTEFDGHNFVARAAAAGAVAALVEEALPDTDVPQLVVSDARAATAHAASLLHGDPATGLSLVGITGTNGKTTTALILRHILGGEAPSAALGTLGWFDATGKRYPGRLTTPDPLELMATLQELVQEGTRFVAMEVSSHALDQRRVAGLLARSGADVIEAHPDRLGEACVAAYLRAKARARL